MSLLRLTRVLLLTQNPRDPSGVARLLGGEPGVRLLTAVDLPDALDTFRRRSVDIVLLDAPASAGALDLVRQTRESAPDLPIVLLTEDEDEELALQSITLGAEDCLVADCMDARGLARALRLVLERRRVHADLGALVLLDELTGLLNRRGFLVVGEQELRHARRQRTNLLIVFMDLDDFKTVNDRGGHAEGDRVLSEVATLLRHTFREDDVVARLGGDEFVALATLPAGIDPAAMLRRLDTRIQWRDRQGRSHWITITIGMERHTPDARASLADLLALADAAMYVAKCQRATRVDLAPVVPSAHQTVPTISWRHDWTTGAVRIAVTTRLTRSSVRTLCAQVQDAGIWPPPRTIIDIRQVGDTEIVHDVALLALLDQWTIARARPCKIALFAETSAQIRAAREALAAADGPRCRVELFTDEGDALDWLSRPPGEVSAA